ncbi:MAG: RNA methyltransferase [Phycisphaerales bacterium]
MPVVPIHASDDPRLADYANLRERDLRRVDEGLFVGEQWLVVERMLAIPGATRSVLVSAPTAERLAPRIPDEVPVYVAPFDVLERIAGFNVHRGVLAIGRRAAIARPDLPSLIGDDATPAPRTLLLCEDITHLDNIGLLFRNAAAFAVDGVLLSPRCHDPLYRKSLRVSIGHALTVPWRRSDDWLADLDELRRRGFAIVGAAIDPGAVALDDLAPPPRTALVVGTEFAGIQPATRSRCDVLVRIPMAAGVDSLNVAVAAAVCLHRFSRRGRV